MEPRQHTSIDALPNEVLMQILISFATPALLRLTIVSHRFAALTQRIYHHRLALAANLAPRTLLLECYHPALRLVEEPSICIPLGTPDLGHAPDMSLLPAERAARYNALYSRFTPVRKNVGRESRKMTHPAGDVPGSRTYSDPWVGSSAAGAGAQNTESANKRALETSQPIRQQINLDSSEIFAQLTAITSLVQIAPRNGLFRSVLNVSEGVIRIFRSWLATHDLDSFRNPEIGDSSSSEPGASNVLWVNDGMNVGVRFGVRLKRWATLASNPVLKGVDDDDAVSYDLEIQGKSDIQRTLDVFV